MVKSRRELVRRERRTSSYVSRMVNLTTLAPDIVAAILDETLPPDVTLFHVAVDPRRCGRSSGGGAASYRNRNAFAACLAVELAAMAVSRKKST